MIVVLAGCLAQLICELDLLALASSVSLGSQVGRSSASRREKSGEDRLDEGAEDNLGAVGDGEGHPENEDELEGVVERYPRVSNGAA